VNLGEEISAAGERLQVKEFVFFETMNGFDVALVGVSGRGDAHMLAVAEGFGEIASEFAAVFGLPDQIAETDSVAIQMLLNARREDSTGRGTALIGKGPEQQAAANVASSVLNHP